MRKGLWTLVAALALALPTTAHADEKESALQRVGMHASSAYSDMIDKKGWGWNAVHETARNCATSIAGAKSAGAVPTDPIQVLGGHIPGAKKKGETWFITFAQAQKFCRDLTVSMLPDMIKSRTGNVYAQLEEAEKAEASEHASGEGRQAKRSCEDGPKMAADLGVTDDQALTYFERKTTIGEIRSLCGQFETIAQKAQERWDQEEKARIEAALEPYKKAGVAGDKLEFIKAEMNTRLYSKGGTVIETPKQFAKTGVVCYVVETSEGLSLVHRYRYKGNKLASSDDATFLTHDKALANCR